MLGVRSRMNHRRHFPVSIARCQRLPVIQYSRSREHAFYRPAMKNQSARGAELVSAGNWGGMAGLWFMIKEGMDTA